LLEIRNQYTGTKFTTKIETRVTQNTAVTQNMEQNKGSDSKY
jgi:hypothetical protein